MNEHLNFLNVTIIYKKSHNVLNIIYIVLYYYGYIELYFIIITFIIKFMLYYIIKLYSAVESNTSSRNSFNLEERSLELIPFEIKERETRKNV